MAGGVGVAGLGSNHSMYIVRPQLSSSFGTFDSLLAALGRN